MFGCPAGEAVGRSLPGVINFEPCHSSWDEVLRGLQAAGHWRGEMQASPPSGAGMAFEGACYRLEDAGGDPVGYTAIFSNPGSRCADDTLGETQALLGAITANTPDHIIVQDKDLRYTYVVNPQLGLTQEDMIGKTDQDFLLAEEAVRLTQVKRRVMESGEAIHFETSLVSRSGTLEYFDGTYAPKLDAQGRVDGLAGFFRNVTARKQVEAQVLRLNRLFIALSHINHTIVKIHDRDALLKEICRVAIEQGGYRMAWVGWLDETSQVVEPVVFAGEERGYLERVRITGRDENAGRGPTGTAIREGKCVISQDIATDPRMLPWRERALERGYRSSAAVPLRQEGRVRGVFTVYAGEAHAFDPDDELLLNEFSEDISFALDWILHLEQRQGAEAELQKRYRELSALYDSSQKLQSLVSPEQLAQVVGEVLENLLEHTFGGVLLLDEFTGMLEPFVLSRPRADPHSLESERFFAGIKKLRLGVGITGWVAQHGESLRVGDVRLDPRYVGMRSYILSELCVPLRLHERVIGVIDFESDQADAFSPGDQRILETVAAQVSTAIHNARLLEETRRARGSLELLTRRQVEVQENERRAIARELNDQYAGMLTALKSTLEIIPQLSPETSERTLAQALDLTENLRLRVNNLSEQLRPPMLDDSGLVPTLLWHIQRFQEQTGITVHFSHRGLEGKRLGPQIETSAYRLVQEALNNVARHAQAWSARVEAYAQDERLLIGIEDSGRGFDPQAGLAQDRGLSSMRERVRMFNGQFHLESQAGRGTRLTIQLPLWEEGGN
jgi:PAS domain S-box-containing protein